MSHSKEISVRRARDELARDELARDELACYELACFQTVARDPIWRSLKSKQRSLLDRQGDSDLITLQKGNFLRHIKHQ